MHTDFFTAKTAKTAKLLEFQQVTLKVKRDGENVVEVSKTSRSSDSVIETGAALDL